METSTTHLTEEEIALRLAALQVNASDPPYPEFPFPSDLLPGAARQAAVLIPLLRKENAWHILFTRRNADLPEHSGQVAFPGGRSDPDDTTPEATALREAWEEVGLKPGDVRILGRINDFLTITNYHVTPVIGVMPWPYPLRLAVDEVSRAFTIPLDWLANPANYEVRQRSLPDPYPPVSVIYYRPYEGETLWGASARFTITLLRALSLNGDRP